MMPDALKIFDGIMASGEVDEDPKMAALQLKAAKEVLGIGGYSPVKQTVNRNISTTLTTEDLKELTADADRLGITMGECLDAEYEEINEE